MEASRLNTSVDFEPLFGDNTTFPANDGIGYEVTENGSLLSVVSTTSLVILQETVPPPPESDKAVWLQVVISIVLICLIIGTIIGNSLVCIAVSLVKRLQTPSNMLILSLALSDLLVAVCVMPFVAVNEIMGYWGAGNVVCDIFTSLDVTLCTASILNLCMISVDRYFVITRPFQYAVKRTPKRMALMIASVWVTSVLISVPPLLGWQTTNPVWVCTVSQDIGYQIYATLFAFYLPLTVMLVVYFRIYRVSSRLGKAEKKNALGSIDKGHEQIYIPSQKSSRSSGDSENNFIANGSLLRNGNGNGNGNHEKDERDASLEMLGTNLEVKNRKRRFTLKSLLSRSQKVSSSKDRRATKTLGVIMGGFVACWLPFFILAVIRPFCGPHEEYCSIPGWITGFFAWCGYFNSFLNPLIYARFNREFRTPFVEILCFRCRGINSRIRSESYVELYGPDPTFRDSLRPPTETIVRYNSHGTTHVKLGNGNAAPDGESKV